MEEDGGYYAMKGFDFQIDKTILAVFKESDPNKKVAIEQIQDINTETTVIQVKYKETQNFANSKIREPVVNLIEEFVADKAGRTFILYCHFKDKLPHSKKCTPQEIDEILNISLGKDPSDSHRKKVSKINGISKKVRKDFSNKFLIQFAGDYDGQFQDVLELIRKQPFCKSADEAIFLYHLIANYLRKIVVCNTNKDNRFCDRKGISDFLETGKKAIFNSTFSEIKSRESYLQFLKRRAPTFYRGQNNCIVLGVSSKITSPDDIADLIRNFLLSYFQSANREINPPMFLIRDDMVFSVKKKLIDCGVEINDGYEQISFNSNFLIRSPVANLKVLGARVSDSLGEISFKLRIASVVRVSELKDKYQPDRVMYLDFPEVDSWSSVPTFSVDDLAASEISTLLRSAK